MAVDRPLIVVLEDDPEDRRNATRAIAEVIPGATIQEYPTEERFRAGFPRFKVEKPDIYIIDKYVRWTEPAPDMPVPPADVDKGGFREAGVRCVALLKSDPNLKAPIIIWTAAFEDPFIGMDGVKVIPKASGFIYDSSRALAREVRNAIVRS